MASCMKNVIKHKFTSTDIWLMLLNLIPVVGVWGFGWQAVEVFIVYCLESVIIGLYNIFRLCLTATVRKTDTWNDQAPNESQVGSWFFPFFFLIHYGFFIALQLSIFLSTSGIGNRYGISNAWSLLTHLPLYLSSNSKLLLIAFVVSHGLIVLKDYVLSGAYRTASMGAVMFEPYGRIFVQQFTVIAGGIFIAMNAGKIFITIFAAVKIFMDVFVNYNRIIRLMAQRAEQKRSSQ